LCSLAARVQACCLAGRDAACLGMGAVLVCAGGERLVLALVCDLGRGRRRAPAVDAADDGDAAARGWLAHTLWLPASTLGRDLRLPVGGRLRSGIGISPVAGLVALPPS